MVTSSPQIIINVRTTVFGCFCILGMNSLLIFNYETNFQIILINIIYFLFNFKVSSVKVTRTVNNCDVKSYFSY